MKAKKQFGQNFLIDPSVSRWIVDTAELESGDHVIEVGPGRGALTELLLNKGISVSAIELDRDLAKIISDTFGHIPNFDLLSGDILKLDWAKIAQNKPKLISNLPYNISGPFLGKLIENRNLFHSIVLMLQKEVANRVCFDYSQKRSIKEYGSLSVLYSAMFETSMIGNVAPTCFRPVPKVESAVIRLVPRTFKTYDDKAFVSFVRQCFIHRRKYLIKSLDSKQAEQIIASLPEEQRELFTKKRAEEFPPEKYVEFFNALGSTNSSDLVK